MKKKKSNVKLNSIASFNARNLCFNFYKIIEIVIIRNNTKYLYFNTTKVKVILRNILPCYVYKCLGLIEN